MIKNIIYYIVTFFTSICIVDKVLHYFLKIMDKKKHADWYLDSTEAKKHNLANQIRIPRIDITVNVTIDLE